MIPLSLAQIANLVNATLIEGTDPNTTVVGVETDSRLARPGVLFVALVGERTDGHEHIQSAMAAGAVAVMGTREFPGVGLLVPNSVVALGSLARGVLDQLRKRDGIDVVAVTGSSGKTSTKDLLAEVLSVLGETVAPKESFNTEIGLPMTVLTATDTTRCLVLEMGARGVGHIATLVRIAQPRIGVVLNVGTAHVGEFGSRDAIARAKAEIVRDLPCAADGGIAVLNSDDPLVSAMSVQTTARVITFGRGDSADVRATDVQTSQGRSRFTLVSGNDTAIVELAVVGEHQVLNALAAAVVGLALGIPIQVVASSLSNAQARSRWRMEVSTTAAGVTIVNDAYNANPESVAAALRALVSISAPLGQIPGRRSWAVLGPMLELGASSAQEHAAVGRLVGELGISRLVAVGEGARPIYAAASDEGQWAVKSEHVSDVDAAIEVVKAQVRAGDVVLVKASRSIGLERLALALSDGPGDQL